jgi:hypothetical protein
MKSSMLRLVLLFLFILSFDAISARAQKGVFRNINHKIEQQLQTRFNEEYSAFAFNRVKTPKWNFPFGFYDPYGTLKDCYIFIATPIDSKATNPFAFIGIYKSGSIIWISKREIDPTNVSDSEIMGVLDLNRDGKVDILTSWTMGMHGGSMDLWIYEWDGTSGRRINQVKPGFFLPKGKQSTLNATEASVELIDVQPDGIKEILAENDNADLTVYSWNGQQYGNFGVRLPHPLPRNGVKAELHAQVTSSNDHLQFHYSIHINKNSFQSLEEFDVKNYSHKEPKKLLNPPHWDLTPIKYHLMCWQVTPYSDPYLPNVMHPGTTDSLFAFTSTGLPRPGTSYLKGNNGDLSYNTDELATNSVHGITLSPYDPPNPFDAGVFTDTLRSFASQACNLKWIDNKGICQSLQATLKNVQKQLSKVKTKTAINDLQAFLNEVEAQKGKHLTSEGYGLLYYNGEYLLKKLRE